MTKSKVMEALYTYSPPPGPAKEGFDSCQELLSRAFFLTHRISQGGQNKETEDITEGTVALQLNQIVQSTPTENQGHVIYGICLGMMSLTNTHPAYIDRFLGLYFKVIDLSPDQCLNSSTTTFASSFLITNN